MAYGALSLNYTAAIPLPLHNTGIRSYTTVSGFFAQDNLTATGIPAVSFAATPSPRKIHEFYVYNQIPPYFGLLDDSSDRWSKFFAHIHSLNKGADSYTSYKVFFLGRHGQGFHNVAEAKYGTPAWDEYWSKLNGDGDLVWGPDAELTDLGKSQATSAHEAWKNELAAGIPLPGKFYVSPLTRALQTLEITINGHWKGAVGGAPTLASRLRFTR
ncbi:hypothetical protein D9615_007908 [Tricholomella constricta]|uniref:Phosphoglycerate mutase n=1 Tax=Tricholomella constricta TaxID=117010 RepID=A0A8H5H4N5_9AGAR|nr:hypothetical protein D9615_007908 [Tricholomella constricta]